MTAGRRGFRFIDAAILGLIVIFAAGLVASVTLRLRSANDRMTCVNHLKQLGQAAFKHQATNNKLPPGWLGPLRNEVPPQYEQDQNLGVLVFLLPFLEEEVRFQEIVKASAKDYLDLRKQEPAWFLDEAKRKIASARMDKFLCPSAPDMGKARDGVAVAAHFAHDSKGPVAPPVHVLVPAEADPKIGCTNYFGVAGMYGRGSNATYPGVRFGMARFEGIFTNRSQIEIVLVSAADGTSNTLLFGEGTGGSHDWQSDPARETAPVQYGLSWMGVGALPTAGGLANHGGPSFWYQFSSAHAGIVHFCFADGAVRTVLVSKSPATLFPTLQVPDEQPAKRDDPYWTFQELGGYRDAGTRPFLIKEEKR